MAGRLMPSRQFRVRAEGAEAEAEADEPTEIYYIWENEMQCSLCCASVKTYEGFWCHREGLPHRFAVIKFLGFVDVLNWCTRFQFLRLVYSLLSRNSLDCSFSTKYSVTGYLFGRLHMGG